MCLVRCSTLLNCQPSSFICVYAMIINNSTLLLQVTDRTTVFCVTRSSLSRRRWKDTWESTRESGRSAVPSASWGSSARPHWNDILRLTPEISRRWRTAVIWSKGWVAARERTIFGSESHRGRFARIESKSAAINHVDPRYTKKHEYRKISNTIRTIFTKNRGPAAEVRIIHLN